MRHGWRRTLANIVAAGCGIWVALVPLLAARWSQPWPLILLNMTAPWAAAGLTLGLLGGLAVRHRLLIAGALLGLCAWCWLFFPVLAAPTPPAPPTGLRLRLLTFNHLASGSASRTEDILAMIRASDADIIAIQELSHPVAEKIASDLATTYPCQRLLPSGGVLGMGLLSRYPCANHTVSRITRQQRLELDIDGRTVAVMNVHPSAPKMLPASEELPGWVRVYNSFTRSYQLDDILNAVRAEPLPLILMGDFNTSDREAAYTQFTPTLRDVYREAGQGFGFTFPSPRAGGIVVGPFIRIDYIWASHQFVPLRATTHCQQAGSDHCAVSAEVSFP